ncbi:MAG TPA: class I SAM-dependent methyltransferase [Verrucomicrobiae bacterium]
MSAHSPQDLQRIYESRFAGGLEYRRAVWRVLIADFFGRYLRPEQTVLDLGCGYGEFINQVPCARRFAMDLNPESARQLAPEVKLFPQDCATPWPLTDSSLDVVFTSNFFEHLPDKASLGRTLDQIRRCLKPGGCLIALGPNIMHLPGRYWDFWDHHLPLTENSLAEALETRGFGIELCLGKFLPHTMARGPRYPLTILRLYLRVPLAWRILGKQFLVVARTPQT